MSSADGNRLVMTRKQYAQHRGCTVQAVGRAIREGRIETRADGRIDVELADFLWKRRTDSAQSSRATKASGKSAASAPDGLDSSRARREAALAQLAELELAERCGELVRRADVERHLASRIIGLREALLAIPDRIGPASAGLSAAELSTVLRAELEHATSAFCDLIEQEKEPDGE